MNKSKIYSLYIIAAGVLWGTMGVFVRSLHQYNFTSMQISALRLVAGVIMIAAFAAIKDRRLFRIAVRDICLFVGMGVLSVMFMSWLYFSAIIRISMGAASILLYTAPIWVLVASVLFYKEKFTIRKGIALVLAFGGCVAVSGFSSEGMSVSGVLFGLGSGVAYALYSIIGKRALQKYSPITVTLYAFIFGAIATIPVCDPIDMIRIVAYNINPGVITELFGLGFVTVFAPYLLYTAGLSKTPAGKAAIMASAEPMTATVLGIVVYREALAMWGIFGILMIVGAIVLLNIGQDKQSLQG